MPISPERNSKLLRSFALYDPTVSMMKPSAGLNCAGNVLLAAARLGWMRRSTCSVTWRLRRSSSWAAVAAGGGAAGGGVVCGGGCPADSFSMIACWRSICCLSARNCFLSSSSSRRTSSCPSARCGAAVTAATTAAATSSPGLDVYPIGSSSPDPRRTLPPEPGGGSDGALGDGEHRARRGTARVRGPLEAGGEARRRCARDGGEEDRLGDGRPTGGDRGRMMRGDAHRARAGSERVGVDVGRERGGHEQERDQRERARQASAAPTHAGHDPASLAAGPRPVNASARRARRYRALPWTQWDGRGAGRGSRRRGEPLGPWEIERAWIERRRLDLLDGTVLGPPHGIGLGECRGACQRRGGDECERENAHARLQHPAYQPRGAPRRPRRLEPWRAGGTGVPRDRARSTRPRASTT